MTAVNNSIQIHLNSKHATRLNGSYNSHLEFHLPLLSYTTYYTLYLSVAHAAIPYSFYSINETNNILNYSITPFDEDSPRNNFTKIITPGNYTSGTLILELEKLMGPDFKINYIETTNKITFQHITNNFIFFQVDNSILDVLGFDVDNYTLFSSNKRILKCHFMLNLFTIRNLCISTLYITENIKSNSLNFSTLCSIPITTTPYTVINYINLIDHKINLDNNIFNHIIIKVSDQNGNFINFNNQHYDITLQLSVIEI